MLTKLYLLHLVQEKDQGFGDVGVDQEPDTGAVDTHGRDPDFRFSKEDAEAAERYREEEAPGMADAAD